MEYLGYAGLLAIVVLLITKIRSFFFKATDNKLVKEDQALKSKADHIQRGIEQQKKIIEDLKAEELTPDKVEEFWNKK